MALVLEENQRVVPVFVSMARSLGVELTPDHRILDFGCAFGRHVQEFLDEGFTGTVGVDIDAYPGSPVADHLHVSQEVDGRQRFPFEDDTFDFCYSTAVMEHVHDYDGALAEMHRVLKPGAYAVHSFPARWRPVEAHVAVPFGGRFQHPLWLKASAAVGIRGRHQKGMTAAEAAQNSDHFLRTFTHYPTQRQIERWAGRYFSEVRFAEPAYIEATKDVSRVSQQVLPLVRRVPELAALYRGLHYRALVLRK